MSIRHYLIVLCALFFFGLARAQLQNLKGKVIATGDVEGIHILNKTALKYTITDADGSFEVLVKVNDTITVSSLKYETKDVRITTAILNTANFVLYLTESITELDEIILGRILTGNLGSDLSNLNAKAPINFYDLGIPGYTGKHKTLSERKLAEATTGGGFIPLFPIINAITGRTKMLKKNIQLDKDIRCMQRLKDQYQDVLFTGEEFSKDFQNQFFNFIMDSETFQDTCAANNALNKVTFLQKELNAFKEIKASSVKKD